MTKNDVDLVDLFRMLYNNLQALPYPVYVNVMAAICTELAALDSLTMTDQVRELVSRTLTAANSHDQATADQYRSLDDEWSCVVDHLFEGPNEGLYRLSMIFASLTSELCGESGRYIAAGYVETMFDAYLWMPVGSRLLQLATTANVDADSEPARLVHRFLELVRAARATP